jgi:hypothetical protein
MERRVRLLAALASLIGTFALGAAVGSVALAQSFIGAHSMLQLNSPYGFMQEMFAEAAGMHVSAIRLDVAPSLVFTDPDGGPDFSGLDEVMSLSEQYHLRVVGDLFTIPPWLADCQTPTAQPTRCGTDDLADYQAMIAQIVAHADPVIRDWEIWNEPDSTTFFDGTPQQYALMLRAAHDAIKAIDPEANVLFGGVSTIYATSWLEQVFATPGADAEQAFEIANLHERNRLGALAADITFWKDFLAAHGFAGPLWVTEHGYPSDPAYQYDPAYAAGPPSQAAFLSASIPTLIDAGADAVFVTERDNLNGQYASEGLLGGDVFDPPGPDPQAFEKPAYTAVQTLAECYASLGHDCPGPAPAASPGSLMMPATRIGSGTTSTISVSDPGTDPLQLGAVTLAAPSSGSLAVQKDGCSYEILEPGQICSVAVRYAPLSGGDASAHFRLPSDNGALVVMVQAVSPSVSSLTSARAMFRATKTVDRVGRVKRLVLKLRNPLSAPVHVTKAALGGRNPRVFSLQADRCARTELRPGGSCPLTVLFTPARRGPARTVLALHGDGQPLLITLRTSS